MFNNKKIASLEKEVSGLRNDLIMDRNSFIEKLKVFESKICNIDTNTKKLEENNMRIGSYKKSEIDSYERLQEEISELRNTFSINKDDLIEKLEDSENQNCVLSNNIKDVEKKLEENRIKIDYYNKTIADISLDYKELFKNICISSAKEQQRQSELELKWERDKLLKGNILIQKGADVIDRRKEIFDAMLNAEKKENSKDYINLKEQLKSFDWILEKINEKN